VVRRTLVFGSAFLGLILILRLTSGAITSQSADGSAAPVPVPVVTPAFDCEENSPMPQTFVDSWTAEFEPKNFNATVIDLVEGCSYSMGESAATFPAASTSKVIIAIRVLEMVAAGTLDFANVAQDLELMITESNNESANRLFLAIGENSGVSSVIANYSLTSTTPGWTWGTIQTTSSDQALLLEQALGTKDSPLPEAQRVILRDLMKRVKPEQAWGAGSVVDIPVDWSAGVKNGWYLSVEGDQPPVGLWRINSIGYVWDQEDSPRWIFTGYSNTWSTEEQGELAWSAITKQLSETLGVL
jgi:beta-lactamase class A